MTAVSCPCGGFSLTLAPDKPPLGGKAAFTCPACGRRRAFTRTPDGARFDEAGPAPAPGPMAAPVPSPAAALPAPTPVPPGARLVMTALEGDEAGPWDRAVADAFPGPDWHVLPAAADPAQVAADVAFLRPAVVVAGTGARAGALFSAVAALTGRAREAVAVLAVGDFPERDPLAAFALGADAVLAADPADAAARLAEAWTRRRALPSLFRAEKA